MKIRPLKLLGKVLRNWLAFQPKTSAKRRKPGGDAPGYLKTKGGERVVNAHTDKVEVAISESGTVTITTNQKRIIVIITEQGNVTTMTSDLS